MKIPKVIHRVWLKGIGGEDNPPAVLEGFWEKWKELYPEWEFKTWDGSEFEHPYPEYFDASHCLGWKSDLYRYEVLRRFGGLYVDADIEPKKNAEHLFAEYNVFAAKQLWGAVSNAMIGSVPMHPIWDNIMARLIDRPAAYYETALGGMNVDRTSEMSGPLFINRPFFYNPDASLIPSSIICTNYQNVEDFPDAYAHHHVANMWRGPEAMNSYHDSIQLNEQMDRVAANGKGPGTILRQWFKTVGIKEPKGCACKKVADKMDGKGPDWCDKQFEWIVSEIRKNAEKSVVPFFAPVVRLMVRRSIKKAREQAIV